MMPRSKYADYFGLKIFSRFENRKKGRIVKLSFYDTWTNPKKAEKLFCRVYTVPKDALEDTEENIAYRFAPKLLRAAFPASSVQADDDEQKKFRERCFPHMPLAVIAVCDMEAMITFSRWKEDYANEIRHGMNTLVERYGRFRLEELKPRSISQDLFTLSDRKANNVIRAIQNLVQYENACGFHFSDPWSDFLQVNQKNRKPMRSSGRRNSEIICLSDKDIFRLIRTTMTRSSDTLDAKLFAFLLYLTTPLSLEEICALSFGDFMYLKEYSSCLVVKVDKAYIKKEHATNHKLVPLDGPFQNRLYPLPAVIRKSFQMLNKPKSNRPLIHHPDNTARYMQPSQFRQFICDEIIGNREATLSVSSFLVENKSRLERILKETVRNNLSMCGIEEDELFYLYGKKPKSTSGYFYCDFGAEGELNRLSLLQDRWLGDYGHYVEGSFGDLSFDLSPTKITGGESFDNDNPVSLRALPGMLLSANIKLQIEADQSRCGHAEPMTVSVRSTRGFSATIETETSNG